MVIGGYVRQSWYLSAAQHAENQENGLYPDRADYPLFTFDVRSEGAADMDAYAALAARIGKPYNWDRREVFHDPDQRAKMARELKRGGAEHVSFHVNGHEVGGAIIARAISRENIQRAFHLASHGRPDAFNKGMAKGLVEVCAFGVFPEFTTYHLGRPLAVETFRAAFARTDAPASGVYLETRSTDGDRMNKILKKLDIPVIDGLSMPDDLVM